MPRKQLRIYVWEAAQNHKTSNVPSKKNALYSPNIRTYFILRLQTKMQITPIHAHLVQFHFYYGLCASFREAFSIECCTANNCYTYDIYYIDIGLCGAWMCIIIGNSLYKIHESVSLSHFGLNTYTYSVLNCFRLISFDVHCLLHVFNSDSTKTEHIDRWANTKHINIDVSNRKSLRP